MKNKPSCYTLRPNIKLFVNSEAKRRQVSQAAIINDTIAASYRFQKWEFDREIEHLKQVIDAMKRGRNENQRED